MTSFQVIQERFAANVRDPLRHPIPLEIEPRRMRIYQELIYNNIESFIANGFPILRHLTSDDRWHAMVRDFVSRHASQSPYFCEIGQEFLTYLQNERQDENDPPYLLELAHFEQVELALEISEASIEEYPLSVDGVDHQGDMSHKRGWLLSDRSLSALFSTTLMLSPLAYLFFYRYPVHRFSRGAISDQPGSYYLLIYRDAAFKVVCMEVSVVTAKMVSLFQSEPQISVQAVLEMISRELSLEAEATFFSQAHACLLDLIGRGVLCVG